MLSEQIRETADDFDDGEYGKVNVNRLDEWADEVTLLEAKCYLYNEDGTINKTFKDWCYELLTRNAKLEAELIEVRSGNRGMLDVIAQLEAVITDLLEALILTRKKLIVHAGWGCECENELPPCTQCIAQQAIDKAAA